MNRIRCALLCLVCVLSGAAYAPLTLAQQGTVNVDWKGELAKAKAGIEKDPNSAFWHNQAGVAYNALGDFDNAVKETKLATTLEPSNPISYYTLYALYKRKEMHSARRQVLLDALELDPNNPMGRYEFGSILEEEKDWVDSLREYELAKNLAASVKGPAYIDLSGNAYSVDGLRAEVDRAIDRIAKLNESSKQTYSPESDDETEMLFLVLKAEVQANHWSKNEKICFSVKGLDPSPGLVKNLRQRDLNLCSPAEWRKKFNCGFEIELEYENFALSQGRNIGARVLDLRDINGGVAHIAVLQRDVEYSLRKTGGQWSITDCVPTKQAN